MICDHTACRLEIEGQKISFLKKPEGFVDECKWSNVVLSLDVLEDKRCDNVLVRDKLDGYRRGAHALWLSPVKLQAVEDLRGRRPWND